MEADVLGGTTNFVLDSPLPGAETPTVYETSSSRVIINDPA